MFGAGVQGGSELCEQSDMDSRISREALIQEVTHMGVDVLIGRSCQTVILVRVPLRDGDGWKD